MAAVMASLFGASGCLRIKSDPVRVEPIHVTVDINIRVEKELDNFFDDLDSADPTIKDPK
jgi:hypothetical protein